MSKNKYIKLDIKNYEGGGMSVGIISHVETTLELAIASMALLEELADCSGNSLEAILAQMAELGRRRAARENNGKEV